MKNTATNAARVLTMNELALGAIKPHPCSAECKLLGHAAARSGGWLDTLKEKVSEARWQCYADTLRNNLLPLYGDMVVDGLVLHWIEVACNYLLEREHFGRQNAELMRREVTDTRDTVGALRAWAECAGKVIPATAFKDAPKALALPPRNAFEIQMWTVVLSMVKDDEVDGPVHALFFTRLDSDELLALKWADVDLKARTATVRRNAGEPPHTLPVDVIMPQLRRARREQLNRLSKQHRRGAALRFLLGCTVFGRRDGTSWDRETLRTAVTLVLGRKHLLYLTIRGL